MGREAKRVPLDFGWPQGEVWPGYLTPDWLCEDACRACWGTGYSERGNELRDLWYGAAPFRPEDNGSTPFGPDHPAIRARAERNVTSEPGYYGAGAPAIDREARRLAALFDGSWKHHLNDEDVAALRARSGPKGTVEGTTREFNEAGLTDSMGPLSLDAYACISARCEREGVSGTCDACDGHGQVEKWGGQRAAAEAWPLFEPPTGEGWQLWENTSEGSPSSPVFPTADALADWLVETGASYFGSCTATREQWMDVINGAPAMMTVSPGVVVM